MKSSMRQIINTVGLLCIAGALFAILIFAVFAPKEIDQKWEFVDKQEQKEIEKMWGFIDKQGKIVIPPQFVHPSEKVLAEKVYGFSSGLASVHIANIGDAVIDKTGEIIIASKSYSFIGHLAEGKIAAYKMADNLSSKVKSGYLDIAGKEVIAFKYDRTVYAFSHGFARVKSGNFLGFINHQGKAITAFEFEDARDFSEGLAAVKKDGRWGFIDITGKMVIETRFEVVSSFVDGLAIAGGIAEKGDYRFANYGFIDKTGKYVVPQGIITKYDYFIENIEKYCFFEGLAKIDVAHEYGFIDKTGKRVIKPKFAQVGIFQNGLTWVKKGKKYGFIDKTGKLVIGLLFTDAGLFFEGLAAVKKDGKYGFIDKTGKLVIVAKFAQVSHFKDGLAKATIDNKKWGFIDKTGKFIIAPEFIDVHFFYDGLAKVLMEK